jgi:hypothetical protein
MSPARAAADSFNEIATLRIELKDSDPVIWRQVEVPTSITLKILHNIIQAAAKEWLDGYDPDEIDELPIKYALGRIANQRNAAKARLAKKKQPTSTG